MALWKAKSLSPEQKVRIVEEESSEAKGCLQSEESGSFLGLTEVSMSEVLSSTLSVPVSPLSLSLNFVHMNLICTLLYYHVYFMTLCLFYVVTTFLLVLPDQRCYGAI